MKSGNKVVFHWDLCSLSKIIVKDVLIKTFSLIKIDRFFVPFALILNVFKQILWFNEDTKFDRWIRQSRNLQVV